MVVNGRTLLLGLLAFLGIQLPVTMADCPLDVSGSNFTLVASMCSNKDDRGKCCRYINAFIAVSIARYANATSNLGVTTDSSEICLNSILQTMELYGVPRNATVFCGLGTKIPVNYDCKGRTTVMQMLQSPRFEDVSENCKLPLSKESNCRKCLNAGIIYLHRLVGTENNMTLSTCRDATYAALASQVDDASALELASCFFQVPGLNVTRGTLGGPKSRENCSHTEKAASVDSREALYADENSGLIRISARGLQKNSQMLLGQDIDLNYTVTKKKISQQLLTPLAPGLL